jgi:hypothetical protein
MDSMNARTLAVVLILGVATTSGALAYTAYVADLHAHTFFSDGIGTPSEAYTYARDVANIDVLALTEHTHMMSATTFNNLLSIANSFTQDGVFVALGAQEFGNLNDFNHMAIYDVLYRNPNPTDALLGTYQFIKQQGGFAQFNHPNPAYGTNFNDLAFYPEYVNQMTSIEIRNGLRADNYEPQYIQALNNGWRVGPSANQDNHEGHWGDQQNPGAGLRIYLTAILANSLTRADILDALRQRRFFAEEIAPPDDRMHLEFYANGAIMGQEITTGPNLLLTGTATSLNGTSLFNYFDLFEDGVIIYSKIGIGTSISLSLQKGLADGEHHYYFIRAHQVDGDYAWSSPIWVTCVANPADLAEQTEASDITLLPNAPNPFGPATRLVFSLPNGPERLVGIRILDLNGRLVGEMKEAGFPTGVHDWTWSAVDPEGRPLPAGVYFSELRVGGARQATRRLVLAR